MTRMIAFGPFRLDRDAAILFHDDEPTPLGPRGVALLGSLLDQPGVPVAKADLIAAAWPGQVVEDSNLTVQMAAIRRILSGIAHGAEWIETLPRRGYRYVGPPATRDADVEESVALALPNKPSIAVLPFTDLSGDAGQSYFIDGIVDDIVTGLSRINWLFVIARNSTLRYRDRGVDMKQGGRISASDMCSKAASGVTRKGFGFRAS